MLVDIVMPKMGESITEGTILEWRKKVGDPVEKDELFLEIGTDKVDSEIPSLEAGIIVEILALENDVVDVGTVIARIETDESLVDISLKFDTDQIKRKLQQMIPDYTPQDFYALGKDLNLDVTSIKGEA